MFPIAAPADRIRPMPFGNDDLDIDLRVELRWLALKRHALTVVAQFTTRKRADQQTGRQDANRIEREVDSFHRGLA